MNASKSVIWRNWAALALGLFGLTAMAGDLIGSRTLKGIGAVSMVAPFPKVFCNMGGYEGFACDFVMHYDTADGRHHELPITPEVYARLTGPYNRRNVYGAALAGAPILPAAMWQSVFHYGFKPGGPLRTELGVPDDAESFSVVVRARTKGIDRTWTLKPSWTE
jgi:hypothetical protein